MELRRARVVCWVLALCGLGCNGEIPESAADRRATRVVLITLDTMRLDSVEGSVGGVSPMPLLEDWSRRALVMQRHYAATSTTQPTHASLLTGLHPWQHGVSRNGQVLGAEHETLAEIFAANGYQTGAVVSSFPLHRSFGFDQGFANFDDAFDIRMTLEWSGKAVPGGAFYSLGKSVSDKAIALVDELAGPRQFFWFHYFDLHEPYGNAAEPDSVVALEQIYNRIESGDAHIDSLLARARQRYDADARSLDLQLDRLLRRLTRDADRVDTHILVASDHGESFGEDGSIGHGKRLSDALIRVPCLLISPAVDPGRVSAPVGSIDVPVTLLALAGLSGLEGGGLDMTRVLPSDRSVFGMRRTFEQPFYELRLDGARHRLQDLSFFLADRTRVIVGDGNGTRSRAAGAAGNLQTNDSEALENAQLLFDRFAEALARSGTTTALDERSRAALEALGYIQ